MAASAAPFSTTSRLQQRAGEPFINEMKHPIHELSRPNFGQDTVFKDLSKTPVHRLLHTLVFSEDFKPDIDTWVHHFICCMCVKPPGSLQRTFTPLSQISGCLAAMKCLFRMVFVVEVRSGSPDEIHRTHRYIRYDEPTPFHVLSFLLKLVKRAVGRDTSPGRIEWSDGVSGEFMKYKGQPVSLRDMTSTARNGMVDVRAIMREMGVDESICDELLAVIRRDFTLDEDKEEWFHYSFVAPLDRDQTVFGEVCSKIYQRLGFGFDLKSEFGMRSSEPTSDMQVNRHGIGKL
jgi:hypothetical protein